MSNKDDLISRRDAIDALHTWFRDGFDEDKWWNSTHVLAAIEGIPSARQGYKWETCFGCPLSHGCPKIKGCTNEQAVEYASQIPNDCPLSTQSDHNADIGKKVSISCGQENDLISRRAAIDAYGDWYVEEGTEEGFIGTVKQLLEGLPSAQPEQRWIPVTERLPENDNEVLITVWDAEDDYVEVYKGFYQGHEWWTQWCHGCSKIKDEPCGENIVIAWMPLPEPYKGGDAE